MRPHPGPRQPRTLADWLEALAASGWEGRTVGREHVGPCPRCGGTDRFSVKEGRRVAVAAHCRHGCTFPQLAEAVHGPVEARKRPMRPPRPPKARRYARGPENGSQAVSGGFGRVRGGSEARKPPVTNERHPPRGRSTPGIRPGTNEHAPPVNAARRLWERSRPVPDDPEHPARRWSARRNLWPPGDPWPDSVRWIERADGGSLVAAFAPVADWLPPNDGTAENPRRPGTGGLVTTFPDSAPRGVQLLHVDADGRPRLDRPKKRGGLAKRSRGSMTGAVCLIGALAGPEPLHVVEGIADALAVAARKDGAVIAAGGAGGFGRLAPDLAALARPVLIHADGDPPGIVAARRLLADLTRRGIAGAVRTYPPGCDPAQPTR